MVGHRGLEPRPVGLQPTALPVKLTAQVCHLNGRWRAQTYLRQQVSQDFLGNRSLIIAVIRISSPKIILHSAPYCNQAIAPSVDSNHSYFMLSLSYQRVTLMVTPTTSAVHLRRWNSFTSPTAKVGSGGEGRTPGGLLMRQA